MQAPIPCTGSNAWPSRPGRYLGRQDGRARTSPRIPPSSSFSWTHHQLVHFGVDATNFRHLGLKERDVFLQDLRSVAPDLQGTKQLLRPPALSLRPPASLWDQLGTTEPERMAETLSGTCPGSQVGTNPATSTRPSHVLFMEPQINCFPPPNNHHHQPQPKFLHFLTHQISKLKSR